MNYRAVLTEAPEEVPLTIEEAKRHLNVTHSDDDTYIEALLAAGVAHLDGSRGIVGPLLTQSWRQDFDGFADCLRLPLRPAQEITSLTYKDASNVAQTVSGSNYSLLEDDLGPFVRFLPTYVTPVTYINGAAPVVSVTFVAGYGDEPEDVPQAIRQALLLLIGHWYQNREAVVIGPTPNQLPMAVDALLAPYRTMMV